MHGMTIKEFPNYEVTVDGQIWSNLSNMYLTQKTDKDGYKRVLLRKNGKTYSRAVHRLVAQTYIPNPLGLPEVNHINHVRDCNIVQNLEWTTKYKNRSDTYQKNKKRTKHYPIGKYDLDGNYIEQYDTYAAAARSIKGNQKHHTREIHIRDCCMHVKPDSRQYLGYIWKYVVTPA